MRYLFDTNIVSETSKIAPNPKLTNWLLTVEEQDSAISILTIGEIWKGIEMKTLKHPDFNNIRMEEWALGLESDYTGRILPVTREIALQWGKLAANHKQAAIDLYLAATALVHDLEMVTRNERHFLGLGVPVVNPFS